MPRSSFSSKSSSKPIAHSPKTVLPSPTTVTHSHKIEQPGFFSNLWQGFGLGAGQSIAMNMFRSPTEVKHTFDSSLPKEYIQCMKENQNDTEACKQYLTK